MIDYPDGRRNYIELGVIADPGQSLTEAMAAKRAQAIARHFANAQVPQAFREWSFGSFPDDTGKAKALHVARTYAGEHTTDNLLFIGAPGTGKTGLAVCILLARAEAGVPSLFVAVPDLLDKIRATFSGQGNYEQLMETVNEIDFLVLDDLGAHYATEWAREKLFQIIGHRHDWMRPMVITSDRTLAELEELVGRRTLARIVERGQVVEVGGRDLRRLK